MPAWLVDTEVPGAVDGVGVLEGGARLLAADVGGPRRLASDGDRGNAGQVAAAVPPAAVVGAVVGGGVVPACPELFLGSMWSLLKPGVAPVACPTAELAGGLDDAGVAKLGVLDEVSGPDGISPGLAGVKPNIGLGLPAVSSCGAVSEGIKLKGAGLGEGAAAGVDALANMLALCSPFAPATAYKSVMAAHWTPNTEQTRFWARCPAACHLLLATCTLLQTCLLPLKVWQIVLPVLGACLSIATGNLAWSSLLYFRYSSMPLRQDSDR